MASVAFGGGLGDPEYTNDPDRKADLDPKRAAAALRQAGYHVFSYLTSILALAASTR
jgi:hypothetical protein